MEAARPLVKDQGKYYKIANDRVQRKNRRVRAIFRGLLLKNGYGIDLINGFSVANILTFALA